jgi:hypothetical protein
MDQNHKGANHRKQYTRISFENMIIKKLENQRDIIVLFLRVFASVWAVDKNL